MFVYEQLEKSTKPYIIAEIGANHNGNIDLAKRMIEAAKECGADCAKFQSWSKHSVFSKKVYEDNYFLNDDYRNREDYSLEEIVDKFHLNEEGHIQLKKHCDEVGIDFASTPFSKNEVDLLVDEIDVPFVKVASMDLNNIPFLQYIATKDKPVILSTGLGGLDAVIEAVECLEKNGCRKIALLHCVSIYPPKDSEINLNNIDMLRDNFGYPVGYSDHSIGVVAPIMSIAKKACIIEKHFTLDKGMFGWDHKVSADPKELSAICGAAEAGWKMLGEYRRTVQENKERREAFQRSIVASRKICKGDAIMKEDLDFKRPGTGIPPKYIDFIVGRVAKRDIGYDELLQMEDV